MSDWITHEGGECPVPPDTMVKVRLQNGNESATAKPARIYSDQWTWHDGFRDGPASIVGYQVIEPAKPDAPVPEPTPAELTLAELHRAITALIVRAQSEGVKVVHIDTEWLDIETMGGPRTYMLRGVSIKTESSPA